MILAGGRGTRLAPFTTVLPKPLLPIGNRAILEVVVKQLAAAGFRDQTFAVGYLAHLIEAVFKDGSEEEKPEHSQVVSMGVYIIDPIVTSYVPADEPIDLPDIVLKLLADGQPVGSYGYDGLWLDIGRQDDYELAISEYEKMAADPLADVVK